MDTILVTFFITETQYLEVNRYQAKQGLKQPNDGEASFELILVDGSRYSHKGKLDFIGREVDTTTDEIVLPGIM